MSKLLILLVIIGLLTGCGSTSNTKQNTHSSLMKCAICNNHPKFYKALCAAPERSYCIECCACDEYVYGKDFADVYTKWCEKQLKNQNTLDKFKDKEYMK